MRAEIYLRHMALHSSIYRNKHIGSYLIMGCELEEFDRDLVGMVAQFSGCVCNA